MPVILIWLLCAIATALVFGTVTSGSAMNGFVKAMAFYSIGLVGVVGGATHMIIRNARRKRPAQRENT